MIQIGDKIISRDLFEDHFKCHLVKCEGNCCVFGESGAPLEKEEADLLEASIHLVKPFMRSEGIRAVNELGTWVIDYDGDQVTPLIGGEECAYVVFEEGIARCALEKAYEEGSINFQKPVSCHLYPIRLGKLKNGVALNYHQWSVCEPARILGKRIGLPVFRFLKEPITRVFGVEFYDELESAYREFLNEMKND